MKSEIEKTFKSNGKLLVTGEYVVLDGALALAVPTKYGQSLGIKPTNGTQLRWKGYDHQSKIWCDMLFTIHSNGIEAKSNDVISQRLLQILNAATDLNPDFLNQIKGTEVCTYLDFPGYWGLGTSSTLIHNMALWAKVDAYQLLELTFGGSGYDIACAMYDTAITYQILSQQEHTSRAVIEVDFNPFFKEHLYFVYLNKKQNSRDGIAHYKSVRHNLGSAIDEINTITKQMIDCIALDEFQHLMKRHESIISKVTQQKTIQDTAFKDFRGVVKSLGAWGGDFVLVASERDPHQYFRAKGLDTIISYADMVK